MAFKYLLMPLLLITSTAPSFVAAITNTTTSPEACYDSYYDSPSCCYCGSYDGEDAILFADTHLPSRICYNGYCDFIVSGQLACYNDDGTRKFESEKSV
ncbi:hypothetical protein F5Y15DRAFT_366453 [Xylariaceae sp. FL0016]|nr:hypothetical protein F5Y15DRAFT_366453 [Xylariaceae sp. FL0016]